MELKQSLGVFVRRFSLLLGALVLVTCFALQATPASAHDSAYVRVVHASPAAGTVDVFVDGSRLLSDFTFGSVTGYVPVSAGSHRIQVAPDGKGAGASVIDVKVSLSAGTYYTAAALGTKTSGFSLKAVVDNNWAPSDKARVRVYHFSPNAGPVKVSVGGNTVIEELTYPHPSSYLTVAPGSYTFKVTAINAGVTLPLSATLKGGHVYSVFAIGLYQGSPALQFVVAVS